jgi:hypothetical protein
MIVKQGTNRYFCFTRKTDFILEIVMEHFAPGTDSMDSDAEIENHERQLEQTYLQLKIAKQFCTTDLDDFD